MRALTFGRIRTGRTRMSVQGKCQFLVIIALSALIWARCIAKVFGIARGKGCGHWWPAVTIKKPLCTFEKATSLIEYVWCRDQEMIFLNNQGKLCLMLKEREQVFSVVP